MNPATMLTISAEQTSDKREQAAAWRRARQAHGLARRGRQPVRADRAEHAVIDQAEATAGPGSSLRTSNRRAAQSRGRVRAGPADRLGARSRRGHPNATPAGSDPARWGHRWSYRLTPDGPDATIVTEIYDCSAAPEHERLQMDNGAVWAEDMAASLERLDAICTQRPNQA